MGWTGIYAPFCPKGQERVNFVIEREGLNWENEEQKCEVLKSALVGAHIWFAIKCTRKDTGWSHVFAAVALTNYDPKEKYFYIKLVEESSGPYHYDCPKGILNMLSEPENDWAREWREKCIKSRAQGSKLSKLPFGTVMELHNAEKTRVYVYKKWDGGRWYVNCDRAVRYSAKYINQVGYHVVGTVQNI